MAGEVGGGITYLPKSVCPLCMYARVCVLYRACVRVSVDHNFTSSHSLEGGHFSLLLGWVKEGESAKVLPRSFGFLPSAGGNLKPHRQLMGRVGLCELDQRLDVSSPRAILARI